MVKKKKEFAESKQKAQNNNVSLAKENGATNGMDGFVSIPEGADESGLPFNF